MTQFHARDTLGLAAPKPDCLVPKTETDLGDQWGLTIHWVGAGGNLFRPSPILRLQGIQRYHMETLGYCDIAYNGAWDADGNTYGLRDSLDVGAHAKSNGNVANRLTAGICFLEDARGWTQAAATALAFWSELFHWAQHKPPVLVAHEWWAKGGRGGTATVCPGPYVTRAVAAVRGLT